MCPQESKKGKEKVHLCSPGCKKGNVFALKEKAEMLKSQADEKMITKCGKGW